ncbi:MAG: hypothetical protein SPE56_10235 [Prevotella sp.]|jgi:hypothetical protein|nr:hypothetical protein [Prevotella sp.]
MALSISNVPVLTGEVADRFVKEAEYNAKHLAGSKYDANAQAQCMSIVERSRRFRKL